MAGVVRTRVGYAGGTTQDPTYHNLADHSETIQIDYDPEQISYGELLELFFRSHNPRMASFSRQYRSAVFYHDEEQRREAEEAKSELEKTGRISTAIEPLKAFYLAEDYHQKYYLRSAGLLMEELAGRYPGQQQFVDSTIVARLNGYAGGYGTLEELEADLPSFELSAEAGQYLRRRVARR